MKKQDLKDAVEKQTNDAARIFLNETQNNNIQVMKTEKWIIDKSGINLFIDAEDYQVCELGKDDERNRANAKLIVTAVNNHNKLIEALKNIVSMNGVGYKDANLFVEHLQPLINEAKQLLKQIEKDT